MVVKRNRQLPTLTFGSDKVVSTKSGLLFQSCLPAITTDGQNVSGWLIDEKFIISDSQTIEYLGFSVWISS